MGSASLSDQKGRHKEYLALLDFGALSKVQTGFGYLGDDDRVIEDQGVQLWINCRMTHVFSLAKMHGIHGACELAEHGVHSLLTYMKDPLYEGWYSTISISADSDSSGLPMGAQGDNKQGYAHAFVLLAAASASIAGIKGGDLLLADAIKNQEEYWWEEPFGVVRESWDRQWRNCEKYRGANANMHTVEAYLATYDATGDNLWLRRAARIAQFFINVHARNHGWHLPEHYDQDWNLDLDYNKDNPSDPFRPWGATPGHGFEWARLCVQLYAAVEAAGLKELCDQLAWVHEAAFSLYKVAWNAWGVDGHAGFVYTTDLCGKPVSCSRMHWVFCEAYGANVVLQNFYSSKSVDDAKFFDQILFNQLDLLRSYIENHVIDSPGRWFHEIDKFGKPAVTTWSGKPDIYHAVQCLLLEELPVTPTFAGAVKQQQTQ